MIFVFFSFGFTICLIVIGLVLFKHTVIIPTNYSCVVEKLGFFNGVKTSGLHFLHPLSSLKYVNWHFNGERGRGNNQHSYHSCYIPTETQILDPLPIQIISSDGSHAKINPIVYFKIENVQDAVYKIDNLFSAINQKVSTGIRDECSNVLMSDILLKKQSFLKVLKMNLEETLKGWGVILVSIDIQGIEIEKVVKDALIEKSKSAIESEILIQKERANKELEQIKMERERDLLKITNEINDLKNIAKADSTSKYMNSFIKSGMTAKDATHFIFSQQLNKTIKTNTRKGGITLIPCDINQFIYRTPKESQEHQQE